MIGELVSSYGPQLAGALTLGVALLAAGHAILFKRDVRAAIAWVVVISFLPLLGALFYLLFGINRIRRRARALRGLPLRERVPPPKAKPRVHDDTIDALTHFLDQTVTRPLLGGNDLAILENGDRAFPAMLGAIARARSSITLCTYIFDHDPVGRLFQEALAAAVDRGVEVRVLIDAAGNRYSLPSMAYTLERSGIRTARFLPPLLPVRTPFLNLRNHRKLLVVDGQVAFTGGLNIREGAWLARRPRHPVQDLHFQLRGPLVGQLQEVFVEDWAFTTGERLRGEAFFPALESAGSMVARAVVDGPDEDLGRLRWARLGALACARQRVRIVTPYFLPTSDFAAALTTAARRGVAVEILLPAENNLKLVQWASTALLWQVLEGGCRVFLSEPPFDHSKILVVDGVWALVGSANWDPRSFRLNFELEVECQSRELVASLDAIVDRKLERARPVTLDEVDSRPLPQRLRDGMARLLVPFL